MQLRIGAVVMGASDVQRGVDFWCRTLGYVRRSHEQDDAFVVLTPESGIGPNISVTLSASPAAKRPRVHLDLYTEDQQGEVQRLVALGARRVDWHDYPNDADFVVLADTEGNLFCVIDKS